jgi:hypothetical protein
MNRKTHLTSGLQPTSLAQLHFCPALFISGFYSQHSAFARSARDHESEFVNRISNYFGEDASRYEFFQLLKRQKIAS